MPQGTIVAAAHLFLPSYHHSYVPSCFLSDFTLRHVWKLLPVQTIGATGGVACSRNVRKKNGINYPKQNMHPGERR